MLKRFYLLAFILHEILEYLFLNSFLPIPPLSRFLPLQFIIPP